MLVTHMKNPLSACFWYDVAVRGAASRLIFKEFSDVIVTVQHHKVAY